MRQESQYLCSNAAISIKPMYLRKDKNYHIFKKNCSSWLVVLDELPDTVFNVYGTMKYEGLKGPRTASKINDRAIPKELQDSIKDDEFGMPDADADADADAAAAAAAAAENDDQDVRIQEEHGSQEQQEQEIEEQDELWKDGSITIDSRAIGKVWKRGSVLHVDTPLYASESAYFLRFLPLSHIKNHVIPAVNQHTKTIVSNFIPFTYDAYMLWISIWILMTLIRFDDKEAYWNKGPLAGLLIIDLTTIISLTGKKGLYSKQNPLEY